MKRIAGIALIVVVALAVTGAFAGCGCQEKAVENTTGTIDVAKDAAAKAELVPIKTAVQSYVVSNGALPPDASQATLGGYVQPWPTNPFTNAPMKQGDGVGDYVYTPGAGTDFTLAVHLSDGSTAAAP